ncbi:MAG TPA: Crp/Fnr family transcriptional regulator [Candidatus Saccharimonadales bacterium]|nr:Crp/Fnr family transcriptional regulator [Candidatus Saccharimonadales bacterium]
MDSQEATAKLNTFFADGRERVYTRRALILNYGEQPDKAFWITKGAVKIVTSTKDGNERIQHIYGVNELFPAKWIFDNTQMDVAFFAFTEVTVRIKPLDEFKAYIEREPGTMRAVLHQTFAVFSDLINLNIDSADQRIAFKLLFLAERFGTYNKDHTIINCPLTIQELASSIRLSRETTGKILNRFEKHGLLILGRQNILIHPEKLKKVLED